MKNHKLGNKIKTILILIIFFGFLNRSNSQISNDFENVKDINNSPLTKLSYSKSTMKDKSETNKFENRLSGKIKEPDITLYTPPGMIISILAGYQQPLSQLTGTISNYSLLNMAASTASYFEKWGFNVGTNIKLPIGKKGRVRIVLSLVYSKFYHSGNDSSGAFTIKPKMNDLQIGVGGEYAFTQIRDFIPFVGFDITGNILDGSIDQVDNTTSVSSLTSYNTTSRYGFAIGAGADYIIADGVSVVAGVKYNIANLLGKKYDTTGGHEINDASYSINGVTVNAKTISYLNIYAGISLSFGGSRIYF